jgi:hypothetical protein
MSPNEPGEGVTWHEPFPAVSVAVQEYEDGSPVGLVGATTTVPVGVPNAEVTVTFTVNGMPARTLPGLGLVIAVVVDAGVTVTLAWPDDRAWAASPP